MSACQKSISESHNEYCYTYHCQLYGHIKEGNDR